jgi:hypothetical protein
MHHRVDMVSDQGISRHIYEDFLDEVSQVTTSLGQYVTRPAHPRHFNNGTTRLS